MADTDIAALRWGVPLRVATVVTAVVGVLLAFGQPADALVMGIGALVAGVADQRGPVAARIKSMTFMSIGAAIAVTLGVLVSDSTVVRIGATLIVAFLCGYVARMGPRSGIIGQVGLVVFVVFAGAPDAAATAAPEGLLMLAGGAIQVTVAVASQLAGRTSGVRTDICVAWRSAGYSLRRSRLRYGSTSPILKLEAARAGVQGLRADPSVSDPLFGLVDAQSRFGLGGVMVLSALPYAPPEERAVLERVTHTAGNLAVAIGHAVEAPVRTGRLDSALEAFEHAVAATSGIVDPPVHVGIQEMQAGLHHALEIIRAGVPRGPAKSVPISITQATEPVSALLGRPTLDDVMLRHALRLSLATGVGTIIAITAGFPHTYWIPMTVAWVLRPDLAGTGVRVTARLIGTVAGVLLTGLVVGLAGPGAVPVLAVAFIGALVFAAFLVPNYAVSTAGATMFIIALFAYLGDPLVATMDARMLGTAIAGVLAMLVVLIVRPPTTEVLCGALATVAGDLSRYARMVREGASAAERHGARSGIALSRVAAGRVVEAATQEARTHRVHPERASRILADLVRALGLVAAVDIGGAAGGSRGVTERVVDDSADLARRLGARQADEPVPPRAFAPAGPTDDDASRAVDDAQVTFDLALAERAPLTT